MDNKKYNKLTAEESRVIEQKGTERPFTGEYDKHFEHGYYHLSASCLVHLSI